ncbi:hypothetical protein NQ317_014106 [Molorchus minor]|uniref:Ubiquinol-cytochrome c chaperone domain-containing protein n=1 Tax=Molorchus minor TaxID=1323400 RepID=A0ABQ9IUB6_9CUCU|nr:hypothetical protein NQ317_014106 [Molorchus minor]
MLSVRAMADGENGRHLRNYMVEALWGDVSQRVKQLGAGSGSSMKEQIVELSEQLQAALIAYDEGPPVKRHDISWGNMEKVLSIGN